MSKKANTPRSVDTILLSIVGILVAAGFLIFSSASLGLLARDGASFSSVAFSQFAFGIIGGSLALFITSNIYYRHWRRFAFYIFIASLLLTAAVFVPGIGMSHGGATRWLDLGITSVQPSEFLKIGFVVYMATWFSGVHNKIHDWRYGLAPFLGSVAVVGLIMLAQPDTDTFVIIAASGMAMYLAAGARWRDILGIIGAGLLGILLIALLRPYVMERLTTFLDPEADPLGSGYQIQQSLIAIGSGGTVGRGFGQSIQKFEYLPEAIGDSIFAVYAEEFGFLGTSLLIVGLISLALRGYKTASQSEDIFGTLLVTGFITLIIAQAFLNIAAMTGMAPLSGLPLPFISHGGTALMATLASLGIVLNVSKYRIWRKPA
ncbi:MAG: cell division protein FtsW [Candidatus Pacebacteria bacterium]|nr:cell division protein FtsW [Candidatus Paceibacterota bacterium]MBP6924508.1 cell division protein FtsW [Candidatus Paceibacterota bacterium]